MQIRMLLKLLILGGVSLLMLAALGSIHGLTGERRSRLYEVQRDIAESYAGEQRLAGLFVAVQFRETWTEKSYNKEKDTWYEAPREALRDRLLFPDQFAYDGRLEVQERYRGIFKAHVYQSRGEVSGAVTVPAAEQFQTVPGAGLEFLSARAVLLISDPRGLSQVPVLTWNGAPLTFAAGSGLKNNSPGIRAELPLDTFFGEQATFAMDLYVHGMGGFSLVPLGLENRVTLASDWPHPSFIGDFLAVDRTVSADGFKAEWNVNGLASTARQSMNQDQVEGTQYFGVRLIDPVNPYPLTDRALKYGFLFIFLTFAFFFLFELVKQLRIHPVQYGLVGLAQAIFFLLLLSLSEHLGFGVSYLVASAATVGILTFYLVYVLEGFQRGLLFGVALSVLYGTLYALLQSEDHALVAGSALLFALLALAMVLTRKVDWYAMGKKGKGI